MAGKRVSLITMPIYYAAYPSLALASLCAYLRERGIQTFRHEFNAMLDIRGVEPILSESYDDAELFVQLIRGRESITQEAMTRQLEMIDIIVMHCAAEVLRHHPDVVGLSLVSTNALLSVLLAKRIKEVDPGTRIVFGGPECDYRKNAGFLMDTGCVDAIVLGEGEETLFRLVQRFSSDGQGSCPGAIIREGDEIIDGGYRTGPLEMEALPLPDYSDFAFSEENRISMLPVAFNRGCVGRCAYCFEVMYWKAYRQMSVGRAVETLSFLKSEYEVSNFALNQCLLNGDIKWVSDFCDEVINQKLQVRWRGNSRIHPKMDRAFLSRMYAAGCRGLYFGVESGSQPILNKMRKGTKISYGRDVLRAAHECGIWVHAYWILGFPGETREDLLTTLDVILENYAYIDSQDFHVFQLYRGTPVDGTYHASSGLPDGEYWHWRYGEDVKSAYLLDHSDLIVSLAVVFNSLNFQMPLELGMVEEVRRMEEKRRFDIYQLLTVQLFRRIVQDEALMARLGSTKITKTRLLEVYRPMLDELGLDYDYCGVEEGLVGRALEQLDGRV